MVSRTKFFSFLVSIIFSLAFVNLPAIGVAMCTVVPGCGYYTQLQGALPANTSIPLFVDLVGPIEAQSGLNEAIAEVNANAIQNGSGTTFYITNERPTNGSFVILNFNPEPVKCGESDRAAGCSGSDFDSTGLIRTSAHVDINLGVQCKGTACFDRSNMPAYIAAVRSTVSHELYHLLGAGDSEQIGFIMGPFAWINNLTGGHRISPCDNHAVNVARGYRNIGALECRETKD